MLARSRTPLVLLLCSIFFLSGFKEIPLHHSSPDPATYFAGMPPDSLVNYCTLLRAAYFYGQKSTESTPLSDIDVKYFNDLWKQVFDIPFYQTGITNLEFSSTQRFKEGNKIPFPPSVLYNDKNPDTYLLFHVAKEVGKIKSKAFEQCPTCITESINKINALLKGTSMQRQVAQVWLGTSSLKTLTSVQEITDFWLFLRCLTIDDRVNPKSQPLFVSLPPVVKCPDTTFIKCKDEIKPKVKVGYRHCEIGGKVDTIGPMLVKGIDNCPGTIYRYKFVAKDQCLKKDSAYQYFVIKNDGPSLTCPRDTILDCIANLRIPKITTTASCSIRTKIITRGPWLVTGKRNCPDAEYKIEYAVKDTCGREEKCVQRITIQNNPPKIECPPDTIVECSKDIKTRNIKYTISCFKKANVTTSVSKLVKGKPDCDGSIYELIYTVEDSCGRTASCTQKFTIRNKGPEIICPPNGEVLCYDDINVGPPKEVKVACDLKYAVKISDPVLIIGKMNCVGSVYQVIYTVTDECGRTDECEQIFTILKQDIDINCPPDQTVMCKKDIKPATAIVKVPCKLDFKVTTSAPKLISGKDDCPGSRYQVVYHVEDVCGRTKDCVQTFTIDNPDPEIVCYPDITIECDIPPDFVPPVPVVSCSLRYDLISSEPFLISGIDDCDGSVYGIIYTVTDECGRSAECTQRFIAHIPLPQLKCGADQVVECEEDILPVDPKVIIFCDQQYALSHVGPTLVKGKRDCPGAEYTIVYTLTDDCGRIVNCTQKFTIDSKAPVIVCPPDRIVECEDDIHADSVDVVASCGDDGGMITGPTLISGKPGCPNAVYILTYSVTDNCGRTAACKQKFTLSGDDLTVKCPPDTVVRSKADVKPFPVYATTSCDVDATVDSSPPRLVSGTDDQPGAVYEIIYTIDDDCGQHETCVQRFRIIGLSDNCRELCDCYKELKNVSLDLLRSNDDRFNRDVAALIKKYGCKKVKEWAQSGIVDLWNVWSTAEILGSEAGIASDIARRGNINIVMKNLGNINKVIEVLEEAINGEPKKTLEKIAEILVTDGVTYLTGSGTPALVFTSIKSLGEFAKYLNEEILLLNIKTLADVADRDPCIFDPDHFLVNYAKINDIRPGIPITGNALKFQIMIRDYANLHMSNTKLPPVEDIWKSQQNITAFRTATYTMLKEVCQYWCYKLTLKQNLNKLIQEQNLLIRFHDLIQYINNYDCNGNENPCTMDHAELVEVNGVYECQCKPGYKWDPGKIRCIPYEDCSATANTQEVYLGDHYACDCLIGYEWDAGHTSCVLSKPDCNAYYPNTEAIWNTLSNKYECNCVSGYVWNASRTACELPAPDCNTYYPNTQAVFNAQTNKYECNCITGYVWNATRTACELPVPDCNSYYPNTQAVFNAQTNKYECNCITGYVWNATRTACELPVPDCNSYYPNTVAVWDVATNKYLCNCIQGYVWNATRTACELPVPDCNSYYPNTVAVWDVATNKYLCNCIQGYVWNATRTACELPAPDCNSYYPNTVAVWDVATNKYLCNCIQGYVWNAGRTACISSTPDCNSYYPNTVAVWDAATNQYLCNCIQGFEWNATRTGCVASTTRDNPPVNPAQQKTGECNISYGSGANEPEQYTIDVHSVTGTLTFTYKTYTVKDRIHVYYGNAKIFDTGCVGTSGSQNFTLDGYNSVFRIIVDPLCDPTESDTQWDFTLGCPQ